MIDEFEDRYIDNDAVAERKGIQYESAESEAALVRAKNSLGLVDMSTVKSEKVEWMWDRRIPIGKVTLIEGDPGVGKSHVTLALATGVVNGYGLPGEQPRPPKRVLLLSAEDGLGDTVRPRLDAMGADAGMIMAVSKPITLDEKGCTEIAVILEKMEPRLVIVDPLFAYTGSKVDIHRANETREIMSRLTRLAAGHACAIVCVRHLTKGSHDKSIYRGIGSIDVTAAARSVLLVGADAKDRNRRAVVQIKNNLAPVADSIGYSMTDGQFAWTGISDLTAADILAPDGAKRIAHSVEEAMVFLEDTLATGPMNSTDIKEEAKRNGIAERTLYRAKKELGVNARKENWNGGWRWSLPAEKHHEEGQWLK